MPSTPETRAVDAKVVALADGTLSSTQIAEGLGISPRRVRKILKRKSLPRLKVGPPSRERNPAWVGGRSIDHSGYALAIAPEGHPAARGTGRILEHRLVMEQKLGRYLGPEEVVDHIDGLTLHNHPDNLRLFRSNAEHLQETLSGKTPQWSEEGIANQYVAPRLRGGLPRVDTYRQRKEAGAIRMQQILLAALKLGTDSPYLVGTSRYTKKAGIDMSSRSTIARALADLCEKWGLAQTP